MDQRKLKLHMIILVWVLKIKFKQNLSKDEKDRSEASIMSLSKMILKMNSRQHL
jgi:hypothetical protein